MKKILALVLALALSLTMFTVVASGEAATTGRSRKALFGRDGIANVTLPL